MRRPSPHEVSIGIASYGRNTKGKLGRYVDQDGNIFSCRAEEAERFALKPYTGPTPNRDTGPKG